MAAGSSPAVATTPDQSNTDMTWTPSATRGDVVRMVARYVAKEFSIRSGAGRVVIHDSRTGKMQDTVDPACSDVEFRNALGKYLLRRAIYADPQAPLHYGTRADGSVTNERICRVAPLRDVAAIVQPKSKMGGGAGSSDAREWRATVAQKIARARAQSLVTVEQLRLSLKEARNQLDAADRAARRLRGGKNARTSARGAGANVEHLREREAAQSEQLRKMVKTREYQHGLDALLRVCTQTEEVETYLFGED